MIDRSVGFEFTARGLAPRLLVPPKFHISGREHGNETTSIHAKTTENDAYAYTTYVSSPSILIALPCMYLQYVTAPRLHHLGDPLSGCNIGLGKGIEDFLCDALAVGAFSAGT